MAGYPTDVRSAPVNVFILEIENPFGSEVRLQQVTGGRVQNAFRFSRRARSVKNVKRMFAVQFFGGTIRRQRFPSIRATSDRGRLPFDVGAGAPDDYAQPSTDGVCFKASSTAGFKLHFVATPPTAIGGDYQLCNSHR